VLLIFNYLPRRLGWSKAKRDIKRKLRVLNHAKKIGNIKKACRYCGVSRASFYRCRDAYEQFGEERQMNKKPCLDK